MYQLLANTIGPIEWGERFLRISEKLEFRETTKNKRNIPIYDDKLNTTQRTTKLFVEKQAETDTNAIGKVT